MTINKRFIYKVITLTVIVITFVLSIYIIINQLGIVDKYDFGAGAYYYTDIPDYDKIIKDGENVSSINKSIYYILFICWGWLMWKIWIWVDKR